MKKFSTNVTFLFPVFNDFISLEIMIKQIEEEVKKYKTLKQINFLVVDDGSDFKSFNHFVGKFKTKNNLKVLSTAMRSGSQKTILTGIMYICSQKIDSNLIVLDSDGEDRAEDAVFLAKELVERKRDSIIQVERGVRKSSTVFQVSYFFYRKLFRLLVGKKNPPGNFMAVPNSRIKNILSYPGIDKHLAASIMKYSPDTDSIRFNRGKRLQGSSKMNFSSLFVHAYGSLSVFADVIFTRMVIFIISVLALLSTIGFGLIFLKIFGLKIFGWYPTIVGWTSLSLLMVFSAIFIVGCNVILLLLLMVKLEK
jgi:hypothetical protein